MHLAQQMDGSQSSVAFCDGKVKFEFDCENTCLVCCDEL